MKASSYNYIVSNGEKTFFFNGISELYFETPSEKASIYMELIQNPDFYKDSFSSFIQRMKTSGFIIDNEVEEDLELNKKSHNVLAEELYHIMILPTYQCNLRCWYCVQNHQELWMSKETETQIIQLLNQKISDTSIKSVKISWFGGEPLLGYDRVERITSYACKKCSEAGKSFVCDITTNGTLLNRERIKALQSAGVSSYQITIDGDKETHDSIKVLDGASAFEKSLENINIISETSECLLRFNYTHNNLKPESIIECINKRIKPENRKNIKFLLYKVWQEPQSLIDERAVKKMIDLSESIGIKTLLPTCNLCYSDCKHFDCIFPNGKVEKCDNESPIAAKGQIVNGEVKWSGDTNAHIPAFSNPAFPCRKCKYVPVCWGPCVAKRTVMLKNTGRGKCQYADKESEMRRLILNRCRNIKVSQIGY